jgi:tetratricopeptide (TPR) repeat protein
VQTGTESKTGLVERINLYLRAGDYARALDLLRGTSAEFPDDGELSELEKLAQDGVKRNAEAQRLITASQELFAQQKSGEAIQLLREAYELDKKNSLARAILANALVEHAQFVVESDWLEAETLTNQALKLNPAHPTAKTILNLIVEQKRTSSVEDWVARARKLQSSSDPFAALAWVAEGLAVHPHDPKLLLIQDEIQRDQDARRRQARHGDLEELRRLQREIDGATDVAAKQALAGRIQAMAARYWTDGEILSIANALLLRLGLVSQESSSTSPRGKSSTVILHVPRPSAAEATRDARSEIPPNSVGQNSVGPSVATPSVAPSVVAPQNIVTTTVVAASPAPPENVLTTAVPPSKVQPSKVPPSEIPASKVPPRIAPVRLKLATPAKLEIPPSQAVSFPADVASAPEPSAAPAKFSSRPPRPEPVARSNSTTLILFSAAAITLIVATFFVTRRHYAAPVAKTQPVAAISAPGVSAPAQAHVERANLERATPAPAIPVQAAPARTNSEPSLPAVRTSADAAAAKVMLKGKPGAKTGDQPPAGFTPQQKIRVPNGEQAKLAFSLQPQNLQPQPQAQPRLASLSIQGGAAGTAVFVDQSLVGNIQPDGTLSVSTVNPGDHTVELRKERFNSRQLKKHFEAGGTISLAAADAALEAAPESTLGELKITFAPADANVAIVKGSLLKMVSSGVPLDLAPGTYTLTARTAERFTRSATLEVVAGQSKTLDLSLAPGGMSKWDDPAGWRQEKDSFVRKGGDFVLYGAVPASGTFVFSAMLTKGHLLQWVLDYRDPKNYVLLQMDDNNFYRTVIRNGEKANAIIVPDKGDKKSFRTLMIRVSATEIVHQIKHGDSVTVLDRWTQPGANLSLGKFGFYIPGDDQVALSGFAHYADLNAR